MRISQTDHGRTLYSLYGALASAASGTIIERLPGAKSVHRKIMCRLRPDWIVFDGHKLYLDRTDAMRLSFVSDRRFILDFLRRHITPGSRVVDIGAHIGLLTLTFARAVGRLGHVWAFEPDPTNFRLLERNVEANDIKNTTLIQRAVSERTGVAVLYLSDCSALHRLYPSRLCHRTIDVETTKLDDFFRRVDGRIGVIKLDIEGAEFGAIQGMDAILRRNSDVKIFCECVPAWIEKAGLRVSDLTELLEGHGFTLHDVDERRRVVEPTSADKLLAMYPPRSENGTNLWCVR